MTVRVKVCGLARAEDARLAAELGSDFLGLVLADSPRGVVAKEIAAWVDDIRLEFPNPSWVGVFVRPTLEELEEATARLSLDFVQIHGLAPDEEPPTLSLPWIRVLKPETAEHFWNGTAARQTTAPIPYATLIDTPRADGYGGTGETFDWAALGPGLPKDERVFLAGGLDANNVAEAVRAVHPWAIDASSRLEAAPGIKDADKVRAFIDAVRMLNRGEAKT